MRKYVVILSLIILIIIYCSRDKTVISIENNTPSDSANNKNEGTLTDIDGNVYRTIKIGNQWWLAENLKVTHYRNGNPIIKLIADEPNWSSWASMLNGACCAYEYNDSLANIYGYLYNWFAVADPRKISPEGWHVPNDDEWNSLIKFLGGESVAGGKLKEAGTSHWLSPNNGATNESGFTAFPGGERGGPQNVYNKNSVKFNSLIDFPWENSVECGEMKEKYTYCGLFKNEGTTDFGNSAAKSLGVHGESSSLFSLIGILAIFYSSSDFIPYGAKSLMFSYWDSSLDFPTYGDKRDCYSVRLIKD